MKDAFRGKKILIIGGTGTIGTSIAKAISGNSPEVIRIFSRDEYKQFMMRDDFYDEEQFRFFIGDIRDYDRLKKAANNVDIIFHFAAMKHVSACEYNPFEAVKTNIIGTQNVIDIAIDLNVERVIFTSSDKAINPLNTYGATKLLAERLISAAQQHKGRSRVAFSCVRFGNVIGSRGSVIPLFVKQIMEKKQITVTDLQMTRFMMTLKQATDLTLEACRRAKGGEIFVLKMPVLKLEDLVDVIVEETAKKMNIDPSDIIKKIIGLRPGEKMYEELMTMDEARHAIEYDEMFAIQPISEKGLHLPERARLAEHREYSSHLQTPITKDEIREMIRAEGLI